MSFSRMAQKPTTATIQFHFCHHYYLHMFIRFGALLLSLCFETPATNQPTSKTGRPDWKNCALKLSYMKNVKCAKYTKWKLCQLQCHKLQKHCIIWQLAQFCTLHSFQLDLARLWMDFQSCSFAMKHSFLLAFISTLYLSFGSGNIVSAVRA